MMKRLLAVAVAILVTFGLQAIIVVWTESGPTLPIGRWLPEFLYFLIRGFGLLVLSSLVGFAILLREFPGRRLLLSFAWFPVMWGILFWFSLMLVMFMYGDSI